MFGTVVSGALHKSFKESMDRANLAREEYERVRAAADVSMARMNAEREEFEEAVAELFAERRGEIITAFEQITNGIMTQDIDEKISGKAGIAVAFGKDIEFHSVDEFIDLMDDDTWTLKLR